MTRRYPTTRRLLVVAALIFGQLVAAASSLAAAPDAATSDAAAPGAIGEQSGPPASAPGAASARYIIELVEPPLARLARAGAGRESVRDATAPVRVARFDAAGRLDTRSAPAMDHAAYLAERQARFMEALRTVAPSAQALYHYHVAFNGVTVRLTETEAAAARRLPGQRGVSIEEAVLPLMDASLPRIAAPEAWSDPRVGGRADAGRGQRIAVIDSGISARHPFFDPSGFTAPEGFPRASLRIGDQALVYPPAQLAEYTNAKVIVARTYVNPELVDPAAGDPLATYSPLADGVGGFHGAHVAGIAAGSIARGAPGSSAGNLELSGVAPGAYLMAYKFTDAYTPEILAMIDDAVADGADVINNSWGTAAMNVSLPALHPVARAFEAASEAGVVIVAAAGNAGQNGEATLGGPQQMIDSVITVANSQTGRSFAWKLYAKDADLPEPLTEHPTAYEPFENRFGVIEKPAARLADFCNPLGLAFGAAGKVLLEPLAGSCPIPGLDLPIQLPDQLGWVTKLILAGVANAATPIPLVESIVFYGPDGDPQTLVTLLGFLDQVKPLFEQLGLAVKFPVVAVITGPDAMALADWAEAHPGSLRLRLDSTPEARFDPSLDDAINPTSGQGPVPTALLAPRAGVELKPDLSAPGTDIVSANTDADGAPAGYVTASGTSMASPHVAGAAAVVQQVHPDWAPYEVKAALMLTSDPSVTVDGETAPATVQGAGRLNLARAIDPGLLIFPPSTGLRWPSGTQDTISLVLADERRDPVGGVTYRVREEPGQAGPDGPQVFDLAPEASVSLAAGADTTFELRTRDADLPPGVYDGWVVFEEAESAERTLRWRYRLEISGDRQDVLLINVRRSATGGAAPGVPGLPGLPGGAGFEDGPDYSRFWLEALDDAGLGHDLWTVAADAEDGGPPLSVLQRYDLVILTAGDGNAPLDQLARGMTSLQMYLLGGGRLLAGGAGWTHQPTAAQLLGLQSNGAMYLLSRHFAGFELLEDDVTLAGPPNTLLPRRLFDLPILLSSGGREDAADNGDTVDVGRPLAALQTLAPAGGLAPDLGIAAPLVVDRMLPYVHSYLELPGHGSLMTGMTADATLEAPLTAPFIAWRALFAGFPIEAVASDAGRLSRAEFLGAVHRWAIEPDRIPITIIGPASATTGQAASFVAEAALPPDVTVTSWRWDRGDGAGFVHTQQPRLGTRWTRPGRVTVRAEATTRGGHTYVGSAEVLVSGPMLLHVPAVQRGD